MLSVGVFFPAGVRFGVEKKVLTFQLVVLSLPSSSSPSSSELSKVSYSTHINALLNDVLNFVVAVMCERKKNSSTYLLCYKNHANLLRR